MLPQNDVTEKIGFTLTRGVVPLWVLTGAIFKLVEHTPRTLPKNILKIADAIDLNLYTALAALIGLEFLAAAVMLFLRPLARAMAIFMLAVFCLVLIAEMVVAGNLESCGCLGAKSPPPLVMLGIDFGLLVGVVLFGPGKVRLPAVQVGLLTVMGFALSFGILYPMGQKAAPQPQGDVGRNTDDEDGRAGDPARPDDGEQAATPDGSAGTEEELPPYYFLGDLEPLIGRPWREAELLGWVPGLADHLPAQGKRHVIFYSRTCDHCEEMFHFDLVDPMVSENVIAVEIPASVDTLRGDGAWDMPETAAMLLELPLGTDWIMTAPVIFTIEDGSITCANEGDHTACLYQ